MDNNINKLFDSKACVYVSAPMVRYSRLEFRKLVRQYGVDLAFSPMIVADSFAKSEKARMADFRTEQDDRPLIVQFGCSDGPTLVEATSFIPNCCDGVDINCGCPQKWVRDEGFGSALLSQPQRVEDMVKCFTRNYPNLTCSIKIRLMDEINQSVELVRRAYHCGVTFVAVHCRTIEKGSPIDYDGMKICNESIPIPFIVNGDIFSYDEIPIVVQKTKARGVMCARSILKNPAFFTGIKTTPVECIQKYMQFAKEHNTKLLYMKNQLLFMTEELLPKSNRISLSTIKNTDEVIDFITDRFKVSWVSLESVSKK